MVEPASPIAHQGVGSSGSVSQSLPLQSPLGLANTQSHIESLSLSLCQRLWSCLQGLYAFFVCWLEKWIGEAQEFPFDSLDLDRISRALLHLNNSRVKGLVNGIYLVRRKTRPFRAVM